jgi:hypothetical protein
MFSAFSQRTTFSPASVSAKVRLAQPAQSAGGVAIVHSHPTYSRPQKAGRRRGQVALFGTSAARGPAAGEVGLPGHRRRVWLLCLLPERDRGLPGCASVHVEPAASALCATAHRAGKDGGVLVASGAFLTDAHLEAVGIEIGSNYVSGGAMDEGRCPEFEHLWVAGVRPDPPQATYEMAQRDFVAVGVDFFRTHANMGAMVLECTGFSPFARALQGEIGIPVFSWGTLLDYAYSVIVHCDYYGHV